MEKDYGRVKAYVTGLNRRPRREGEIFPQEQGSGLWRGENLPG
jgi:hypothetical protein